MALTVNTLAFDQDSFVTPNKVRYVGPDADISNKDEITLSRTAPKPTKDFRGVARSVIKRSKTVTLDDNSVAEAIVEMQFNFPVGMAQADADALRDDVGDLAISATGGLVAWKHDLTH